MANDTVHDALLETALAHDADFAQRHNKESDQAYLKRLHRLLADISEEAYNEMPEGAQEWYNEAVGAIDEGNDIPIPEGMPAGGGKATASRTAAEEVAEKTGANKRRGAAAAKKAAAKEKAPAGSRMDKSSPMYILRKYLVEHPDASFATMQEFVEKKGLQIELSTMRTARYWINATVQMARDTGHWKD